MLFGNTRTLGNYICSLRHISMGQYYLEKPCKWKILKEKEKLNNRNTDIEQKGNTRSTILKHV